MNKRYKKRVFEIPVVGYGLRVLNNWLKSPSRQDHLDARLEQIGRDVTSLNKKIDTSMQKFSETEARVRTMSESKDNLQQQFALLERSIEDQSIQKKGKNKDDKAELFAEDHLLDVFYTKFEDRFRGTEDMIKGRLKEYLPYFKQSKLDFKKYPVLDIGTGRGELLQLLKENKLNALGIDINVDMIERCKKKGLKAIQGDAVTFLQDSKPSTFGAITGFHIVEHIPFNILLRLFSAAHSSLVENGFVLFETPNPENIIVGSCGFYMDPSHLNPLPPELLAFALETCGFRTVEIRRIHPVKHSDHKRVPEEFINRFYGPRDYAVVGYK